MTTIDVSPLFSCPKVSLLLGGDTIPIADASLANRSHKGLQKRGFNVYKRIKWETRDQMSSIPEVVETRHLISTEEDSLPVRIEASDIPVPTTEEILRNIERLMQDTTVETIPKEAPSKLDPEKSVEEEPPDVIKKTVKVFRGCEVIGGKFEYKAKVKNDTDFVIHNVTVTILGYPEDCIEIASSPMKKVTRIEPSGFRSPQFTFTPTKDCVEGQISATVSYLDHTNKTRMLEVEPYVIRSVCDLLTPLESSLEEFDLLLSDMEVATEERTFNWNAQVLFEKTKTMLTAKNFYIIEAKDEKIDGEFRGAIRGLAEGKYTGKRVALRLIISGPADGAQANVEVEGLGEDIAMLPTTIDEISKGIDSWTCMNCGGALDSNEVTRIKSGDNIECRYCRHIITIDLYRR
jgi:DNA-directed RNA polymerase subunit RPC12/RpoP